MPGLYRTAKEKKELESRNGALQFLQVLDLIEQWIKPSGQHSFLTPETIQDLQYRAIVNIYSCAGQFRNGPVWIQGCAHEPPPPEQVPSLVGEMCDYINNHWRTRAPVHLSAYAMWRMNWIHPFFGGNGRTARAVSYLVLCASLGLRLPGSSAIPDYIVDRREKYIKALQQADTAWTMGKIDLSDMESLLESGMAAQLYSVIEQAKGPSMPMGT